jgi:arylsulfatase A-like enzyme
MLTGLYPYKHGIRTFYGKYNEGVGTLAELLKEQGFNTLARVEHISLEALDITRGFDKIDNYVENKFNLLESLKSTIKKAFIFIHVFDVHKPYRLIKGWEREMFNDSYKDYLEQMCDRFDINFKSMYIDSVKEARMVIKDYDKLSPELQEIGIYRSFDYFMRRRMANTENYFKTLLTYYIEGINYFDRTKFKYIIDALKKNNLWEDSLVIITSDHGEDKGIFNNFPDMFNGTYLLEGQIRVPLIIKMPGLNTRRTSSELVSHVDIVPTILSLSNIECESQGFDGMDLSKLMLHKEELPNRFIYSESFKNSGGINYFGNINPKKDSFIRTKSIRNKKYKFVATGGFGRLDGIADDLNFIKDTYRNILGRFENVYECILWLLLLKEKKLSRDQLESLAKKSMDFHDIRNELYDLEEDPDCRHNLINNKDYKDIVNDCLGRLGEYTDVKVVEEFSDSESNEIEDKLRSLGYI